MITYYVDIDDSIVCPRCFSQDPCEATKHTGVEPVECSRCDEDIHSDTWREKLSKFFCAEELDEIEEYGLQRRLVQILCHQEEDAQSTHNGKEKHENVSSHTGA